MTDNVSEGEKAQPPNGTYNTLIDPWAHNIDPHPTRLHFFCPHCGGDVEQSADNYHYWCSHCGKNAMDP